MFSQRVDDGTEIRLLEERHAAEVYAVVDRNREHIGRWLPWVERTRSEEDTRKFIQTSLREFARQQTLACGMWHRGAFAGGLGAHLEMIHNKASVGYWISAELEGKGIVTRSVRVMLDHLFIERALNRVIIRCAVGNTRSRAIPQRFGFIEEGIHRADFVVGGEAQDVVIYGLLRGEWSARRSQ